MDDQDCWPNPSLLRDLLGTSCPFGTSHTGCPVCKSPELLDYFGREDSAHPCCGFSRGGLSQADYIEPLSKTIAVEMTIALRTTNPAFQLGVQHHARWLTLPCLQKYFIGMGYLQ